MAGEAERIRGRGNRIRNSAATLRNMRQEPTPTFFGTELKTVGNVPSRRLDDRVRQLCRTAIMATRVGVARDFRRAAIRPSRAYGTIKKTACHRVGRQKIKINRRTGGPPGSHSQ